MFLLEWIRTYYEIKLDYLGKKQELKYCETCETLKIQLALVNQINRDLVEKITAKPEVTPERVIAPEPVEIKRPVPWIVKRQMLEKEDRVKAAAFRNAAQPDIPKVSTEELEKEINAVSIPQ